MSGYLDQYGAGEERRNRIIARTIVGTLTMVIVTALGWYLLEHHHQESQVKTFLAAIRRGDYPAAYQAWGCTPQSPCKAYSLKAMMEDWGPQATSGTPPRSAAPDPAILGIVDSESCNNGVLIKVAVNNTREETLWVETDHDGIGYAPYPVCPRKNPFAIMLHRTVGKLRKPLLR
jgi:hypothetical protein